MTKIMRDQSTQTVKHWVLEFLIEGLGLGKSNPYFMQDSYQKLSGLTCILNFY